jgi:DNA processing protein
VKGSLLADDNQALAIVGCRKPTAYGQQAARAFAKALVKAGFTIVSGLAYGIDRVAHETALEQGGRTLAVVAHGVDRLYPQAHRSLRDDIVRQGAVISEFPLGTPALARHFPRRNRLISGLARGVLVIEAARRSGTLITAKWAAEQGREVFALPGAYYSAQSQGCHALISDGAKLVTSLEDITGELSDEPWMPPREASGSEPAALDAQETAIVNLLQDRPLHIDQLSRQLNCPVQELLANLLTLELKGIIIGRPGQHYQVA